MSDSQEVHQEVQLALLEINYHRFILPVADAVTVSRVLATADVLELEYHKDDSGKQYSFYSIKPPDISKPGPSVRCITKEFYNAAKLAGGRGLG